MGERKPSERWQEGQGLDLHWRLDAGFVNATVCLMHGLYEWDVYGSNEQNCGNAGTLDDAKLAAEDALLEIADEIRKTIGGSDG